MVCVAPGSTDTDMLRKIYSCMPADSPERVIKVILKAIKEGNRENRIVV